MKCAICNREFKAITGKHLKHHNLTVAEYKEEYGEVVSDEYKKLRSELSKGKNNPNYGNKHTDDAKQSISSKNKGRVAHNKGIPMSGEQKKILSEMAIARNKKWTETNTHPIVGQKRSTETCEKIKRARKTQVITPESVQKAIQTKINNGYDLAFFRGHKHTEEAKALISIKSKESNRIKALKSIEHSKERMMEYGYEVTELKDNIMYIVCGECNNQFMRTKQYATKSKISKKMCPKCYPPMISSSRGEIEVADFLEKYTTVVRNDRTLIAPQELDIYLPEYKIAIEYHGLYWHSEIHKDTNYHKDKMELCNKNGIRLIQIFEDEWDNKQDIVKSRLLNAIGESPNTIYARKCTVGSISSKHANKFIKDNHIQGTGRANVHLGLHYEDELVAVMTFLDGDISKKVQGWELNRFCNKLNTNVVGGASRLFKFFIKTHNPTSITTFADNRWSNVTPFYSNLGFEESDTTPPNYWYFIINEGIRYHRFKLRKPSGCQITERELRESEGYLRIYDAGHAKFKWNVS